MIKPGDVVKLNSDVKSDCQLMTVNKVNNDSYLANVVYFDRNGNFQTDFIHVNSLTLVSLYDVPENGTVTGHIYKF